MPRQRKHPISDGARDNAASHFIDNIPTLEGEGPTADAAVPTLVEEGPLAEEPVAEAPPPPKASAAPRDAMRPPHVVSRATAPAPTPPPQAAPTPPPPVAAQAASSGTNWGDLILRSAISGAVMALVGEIFHDDIFDPRA